MEIPGADTEEQIDFLFDHVDDLYLEGKFEEADQFFRALNLLELDISLLVAVLSCSFCARDKLPYRPELVHKVEDRLRELAPDRLEGLMRGLR